MNQAIVDVTEVLDRQKITRFNVGLLILAFLVMMTDGYDLGAAAFAGPGLIKEWGLRYSRWPPCRQLRSISSSSHVF
jgi:MFS transporter, AAHS family, 4-hydroxybenzoate transporter